MIRSRLMGVAGGESGSVFVVGAIAVVVFALLGSAVIEVGQWFQHRRHLQVRTDTAALAAGQALNACFNIGTSAFPTEAAADAYIESWALNYGGFSSAASTQTGAPYNRQIGKGTSHMSFQSDTFPSGGPSPTRNLGPECFRDSNPNNTSTNNVNFMADVRTTQSGITPFFSFSPFAKTHGWARVQLQPIKALKPAMPLAIPDVNPKHVAVTFVNSAGAALTCASAPIPPCTFPLAGPTSSGTLNDWGGQATIPMPAADQAVRMRVSIGPANGNCAGVQSTAAYTCYDYASTGTGLLQIRPFNNAAVGATPILRAVTPTTCLATDLPGGTPYFSAYQSSAGNCDRVGVTAVVDFPAGSTNQNVTYDLALKGKCSNNPNSPMTQTGTTWASNLTTLPIGNGAYDICLAWSYKDSSNQNRSGKFNGGNPVQQIFSASDGSDPAQPGGPILAAQLTNTSNGSPGYSFPAGAPATMAITLGLTGGVHVNPKCFVNAGKNYVCATDPTILLRTANSSGSLNYAIDCGIVPGNTGGNLYQMFRYGCANSYSINQPDICPDPTVPAPDPTSCAPVITGDKTGQVRQALNERIAVNGACAPNNYPNTAVPNDPRIVMLVDTDFSAYLGNSGGSSSSDVPVVTFATFYVTGWDRANADCAPYNEPAPANSDSKGNSANLWGHFISFETNGTPSGIKCAANALIPCVAALVR